MLKEGDTPARRDDAETTFVVVFHPGEVALGEREASRLRTWVRAWQRPDRPHALFAGCGRDTSLGARSARQRSLQTLLKALRVPVDRMYFTADWTDPAWIDDETALPTDVAWLKAIDFDEIGTAIPSIEPGVEPAVRI